MSVFLPRITFCSLRHKLRPYLTVLNYTKPAEKRITNLTRPICLSCKIYAGLIFTWPKLNSESKMNIKLALLYNADKIFENGRYEECYNLLTSCNEGDNVDVKWRICRVLYNMSKDEKYEATYKKQLILQAYKIIAGELETNSDNHAVQKWFALILYAKSCHVGMAEKIKQLQNVKKHMDLAVTLNPNDATTLHMLGEWCYQVTEISWLQRLTAETLFTSLPYSTYEDALEYFLRAETARPRFYSINLLRLGICYLKLKKEDQAKYYLSLAASYPAKSNDDHLANREARDLLKYLK